jgi:uncharacterized protein (DUF1501 family)
MFSRRDFLRTGFQSSSLVALSSTVPSFLARTALAADPEKDGRVLVIIQLDGGNDGLNTVVPFGDEGYAKHRKRLRISSDQLFKINKEVGLHPSMQDAAKLLESGRLAIVQGVGYPNPSRSHFRSMTIWQSAKVDLPGDQKRDIIDDEKAILGWLGQALDGDKPPADGSPAAVFVGDGIPPLAFRGHRSRTSTLTRPEESVLTLPGEGRLDSTSSDDGVDLAAFVRRSTLDAYASSERMSFVLRDRKDSSTKYPATGLSERLRTIAQLIKGGMETRIFYTSQASYDTHYTQLPIHADLLGELSGALKAFLDDLAAAQLAERVVVMCFSEFGRRVSENGSYGTDHGTAGPVFVAGPRVKAGLLGEAPSLHDLDEGDLKMTVDFRRVYAAVLHEWLKVPAKTALGGNFEPFSLFQS